MNNLTPQMVDDKVEHLLSTLNINYTTYSEDETIKWNVERLNKQAKLYEQGKITQTKFNDIKSSALKEINAFIIEKTKKQFTQEQQDKIDEVNQSIDLFTLGEMVYNVRKNIGQFIPGEAITSISWKELDCMDLKPKNLILDPVIKEKDLTMLYAERGVGKTHVSLGIAWAVSTGTSFFNWIATKPLKTLFVDGEMPLQTIRERLRLISKGHITNDNLQIISNDILADNGQAMPDLATIEGQEALQQHTEEADFIILDNLATLCRTGKENTAESWKVTQQWLLQLRAKGKTVLVVDHAGKNGTNRGSSAKQDTLDTVIKLSKPGDYESEQGARFIVSYEKHRNFYGDEANSIEAHLVNGEWKITDAKQSRDQIVISLNEEGLSQREIAEEISCSLGTVNRVLKAHKEQQSYLKK